MSRSGNSRIRLFLDANILISSAWKDGSKVVRLWQIPNVELITSNYVLTECIRNLPGKDRQDRLNRLMLTVRLISFQKVPLLADSPDLPEKDRHVLAAAVLSRSDFLVTGDRNHFGAWYGQTLAGIRVEPPARFPEILSEGTESSS
jgi:predicted nucleic acid-binding protein